jgi:hypothetical protein
MAAHGTMRRFLAAALLAVLALKHAAADSWKYVVPPAGAAFERSTLTTVPLSDARPIDLEEKAAYRGERQRYAQIRFGTPGSLNVTLVLDRVSAETADLYVDCNRNLVIETDERVAREGRAWRSTLDAVLIREGQAEQFARTMILQRSRTGDSLRMATCGYMDGSVSVAGRTCAVRRMDGNANGLFSDARDRIWIDLDANGRWDAISEQYLFAPILVLGTARYAVRSDKAGHRLTMEELAGTGTLELALSPHLEPRVTQVAMTLIGHDGSVANLVGTGGQASVPIGDYRASVVTVSIEDPRDGPVWNYVFADDGQHGAFTWHHVEPDKTVVLDPLGTVELTADLGDTSGGCLPGEELTVQPRLSTGDGLVIASMFRGGSSQEPRARFEGSLVLVDSTGAMLDRASIGFG